MYKHHVSDHSKAGSETTLPAPQGTVTLRESCKPHRSVIVSTDRWRPGKQHSCQEDETLPRLAEEWLGQFFQASSCLDIGFSLNWRWKYSAR